MISKLWIKLKEFKILHSTMKVLIEGACELIPPLRKFVYSLGTSPNGLDFGSGDMAKDWDSRSRRNAKWYIYWDACKTEEEFDASGEKEVRDILLQDISINSGCRSLEIGCGIGRLLKPFSRHVFEAYGVDISKEMISQGQERLAAFENINLSVCNGELSGFPDNFFDFCYSLAVFRHIPEKKFIYRYLSEASRTLKPDGIILFEVWGAGRVKSRKKGGTIVGVSFKEEEIREKLHEFGFHLLDIRKRPKLPYIVYTAKRKPKEGVTNTHALKWVG